jgi:hypothetical protein
MGETATAADVNEGEPTDSPVPASSDSRRRLGGIRQEHSRLAAGGPPGYPFLDTGSMYRAITVAAIQGGLDARREALGRLARSVRLDVGLRPRL